MCSDTQKNVQAIQRMLEAAEDNAKKSIPGSDVQEHDTYPLTEIREDLDEEGNIICP